MDQLKQEIVVKASQDIRGMQMNLGDVLPPGMDLFSPE